MQGFATVPERTHHITAISYTKYATRRHHYSDADIQLLRPPRCLSITKSSDLRHPMTPGVFTPLATEPF